MEIIPKSGPLSVEHHKYAGHAFVDKRDALPLQAADMFAWHLRHYYERILDGHTKPRKDYVALSRPFDFQVPVAEVHLLALREIFLKMAPFMQHRRPAEALKVGDQILAAFGLQQQPVWVPRHSVSRSHAPSPGQRHRASAT